MNQINPRKLLHSKWTAAIPQNREKHFLVVELSFDDDGKEVVNCVIEAVMTKRAESIDWQQLKDSAVWRQGWN